MAFGLLAQLAIGAWWVDSVTSLAILWFLIKEGREAWAGRRAANERSGKFPPFSLRGFCGRAKIPMQRAAAASEYAN